MEEERGKKKERVRFVATGEGGRIIGGELKSHLTVRYPSKALRGRKSFINKMETSCEYAFIVVVNKSVVVALRSKVAASGY
jgi:hypothetical protein